MTECVAAKIPADMIDAGVAKLLEYDPAFDNEREIVRAIMEIALSAPLAKE